MKVKLKVYDGVKYWDGTQKVAEVNYDIQGYEVKQIPDEEIAAMGFDTVDEFEEYRKAELVLMNTKAIIGTQQIAYIYEIWGTEAIDILYSLVEERGKLIESLGEARKENSDLWKENRTLREFRDTIIREAQRKEPKLLPLEGNQ